ncbi:sensor histidine kinase [Granulicella arctica]|uniref:sensor histidine kinase n=1 Tax=Granulicella arctica TaxID=940613 RepID=UPI0021E005F0|nr:sensor histidine kinase [Granulicella arctica]
MSFRVRWVLAMVLVAWARSALGLDPRGVLSQYGRQVWETDNGLPQNTVRAIVQTPDGYIWLGTDDGLVRFNGYEFKVFTAETTPELRSHGGSSGGSSIQGLTVDAAGGLWIVTGGKLAFYAHDRFRAVGIMNGLPDATVWFSHKDRGGRLWVSTAGGPCLMQGEHCAAIAAAQGMSVSLESRFAETSDGQVWLGDGAQAVELNASLGRIRAVKTVGGAEIVAEAVDASGRLIVGTAEGLQVLQRGLLAPVAISGAVGRTAVTTLLAASDGSTWVGTSAGLATGNGERFSVVAGKNLGAVQTLFQDREGAIWAGMDRGVARVVGDRVEVFPKADALAGSSVLASFEDREGDLWVGTESDGLTMLHEQKFTTYTTAEGLSGNVVRSVLQDAAGTVWVGTDGGGLNRKTADGFVALTTRDGLSSNVILSLASAPNGDLWVGTPTGLNLVRGRTVKVWTTADGLADDFIRSLLVDKAGDVWVGTRHGLTRIAKEGMTTLTSLDGLGSDFIGVMVQSDDGDLWIGTSGGLTRMRAGKFRNFTIREGLPSNVVTAILPEGHGNLLLGTDGSGLSRWVGESGKAVRLGEKTLPATVFGILREAAGAVWISSRSGIFRLIEATDSLAVEKATAYDTSDGMRVREGSSGGHPAAVRMRDGTLWFATLRGVSVVDPARLHENMVAPLVAVETVLVNDVQRTTESAELTLEPGSQRVEFQYAGMSFVAPQKVRYSYRLEGFDPAWVEAGTHRAAFYTNLKPGHYVFHVTATNSDGVRSPKEATIRVRVRPFFWQTWWFYGVLVLVAAGLAYLIYAWRVRRVEALYSGVMEERSRIARDIHDTLAQGIVSISLQLEVVTRLLGTAPEAARTQLDETRLLVRQSLADARSSIWDLRSEGAEELPVRLGRALKTLTGPTGIAGRLHVTGSYRALGTAVEDEVLRIAQEAVTNAVRHAACGAVEVTLTYEMKAFRLLVVDDGRGFDAGLEGPAGHFGLRGMRERAVKIGGKLSVASAVGQGTRIEVTLRIN